MITQDTAARIWNTYREIVVAEKLLADMAEEEAESQRRAGVYDTRAPTLKDAFGRRQHLQLGVPSGQDAHRLFHVAPTLAKSVITAHIANMRAELAEANEQARLELDAT